MRYALNKLLSSRQVSPYSGSNSVYTPRNTLNLDPASAAIDLGASPEQVIAIVDAMAERNQRLNHTVDEGALAFDQILGTNLSGARKPPLTRVDIADDASYKVQAKGPSGGQRGASTDIEFIRLANTPMMDWDRPDQYHMDRNVTVRNLGDVEDMARNYVQAHPESMLQLYLSPGGYRGWELSEAMNPKAFAPRFDELNVDPDYARIAQSPMWGDPSGFASRISHKPGRTDWAAQPLTVISGDQAIPNSRSIELVERLHDRPIRQAYLTDGYGASADAMTALQTEIPNVSNTLAKELQARFHL